MTESHISLTASWYYNPWKRTKRREFHRKQIPSETSTGLVEIGRSDRVENYHCDSTSPRSTTMPNRPLQKKVGQKRRASTGSDTARHGALPQRRSLTGTAVNSPPTRQPASRTHSVDIERNPNDTEGQPRDSHSDRRQKNTTMMVTGTDVATNDSRTVPPTIHRAQQMAPRNRASAQPANSSNNTDIHSVVSNTILEMLKGSEARIVKQIVSQQRILLGRIDAVEDRVKEFPATLSSISHSLTALQTMVLPSSNTNGSNRNSTRHYNQTKSVKLQKEVITNNPTLPAELKIVFETDVASIAAAKAIAFQMAKFHRTRESAIITARVMHAILYGLKKEMPKSTFKYGIGYRHAEFRFKVAKVLLELARGLPERLFTIQEPSQVHESQSDNHVGISHKPSWLTSDLVDSSTMSLARKHHECVRSEIPADPSTANKRKALFIAKSIVKVVIDMLRLSREKSKVKMFEDGLCCLMDWESLQWFPEDLTNAKLSFLWPDSDVVPASEIQESLTGDTEAVGVANSDRLLRMISERKEMLVEAIYDVYVTKPVTLDGRKRKGVTEQKTLRRIINILRISKSFMCSFCHLSEENLLRTHPSMLQCLYRFAVVLRNMFASKIYRTTANRSRDFPICRNNPQEDSVTADENIGAATHDDQREIVSNVTAPPQVINDRHRASGSNRGVEITVGDPTQNVTPPILLNDLFPPDSQVDRIMHNTLTLSMQVYNKIHFASETERETTQEIVELRQYIDEDDEIPDSDDDNMSDMFGVKD